MAEMGSHPQKWANSVNFCCLLSVMGIHACVPWAYRDILTHTCCSSLLYASSSFGLFNFQLSNSLRKLKIDLRLAFLLFQLREFILWTRDRKGTDCLDCPRRFNGCSQWPSLHLSATTRSACFGTAHASTSSTGMTSWVASVIQTSRVRCQPLTHCNETLI